MKMLKKENVVNKAIKKVYSVPFSQTNTFQTNFVIVKLDDSSLIELDLIDYEEPTPLRASARVPEDGWVGVLSRETADRCIVDVIVSDCLAGYGLLLEGGVIIANDVFEHENKPTIVRSEDLKKLACDVRSYWETETYRRLSFDT